MKNIKIQVFFICIFTICSCRLITFTNQPGSQRNEFPSEMHGVYMAIEKHKGRIDTTVIKIDGKSASSNDRFLDKLLNLTDSTTLTHLGDFYFFNVSQNDSMGKPVWWSFPLLVNKKGLYVFTLSQGKQQKKLGKYLTPAANGQYVMDNEPFKNYCEKHLKKRKATKLKRIK